MKLITRKQYDLLKPIEQGYVHYMQEAWPGSELKGTVNPYVPGSLEHAEWANGQQLALLDVQDMDD